ncbi:helix-turn-helix domain-containing protein [Schleiferilactobacillus shenzhenensis]|uniref:DnaD domain-containing protein n=1 Tax=Schleiferilactobacillus shenzhenensis LY-73 TaxID=1231336 RepID=U4TI51_9LACO|nr:helix-turn-helix domain-containing protein [Schleiferilactobacillus shenzhenensis]ERL63829.1 hypothetical protein L248_2122 [Schleiferilactobacillus shenzhenensis LY-73]
MDYFKQRRAFRQLLTEELNLSLGQICLYRELLDYANDEGKMQEQFRLRNSVLASRTGLSEEGVKNARNRLVQEGLIKYTPGKKNTVNPGYQLVRLYKEYPNRQLNSTPDCTPTVLQTVPQLTPQPAPQNSLLVPDYDLTKDKRRNSRKREYADDAPEMVEARYLWGKIKANNPEAHKAPNIQHWADDIRKMHDLDGRSFDKIHRMIDWSQADTFWGPNILSAKKLREKYLQMAAQANAEHRSRAKPRGYQEPNNPGAASLPY